MLTISYGLRSLELDLPAERLVGRYRGPDGLADPVAAVRETSVLIAVFLAAPLLGEKVGPVRLGGAALVVAGVALVALG